MVGRDWISRKREYTMTVMIYYQKVKQSKTTDTTY
jgi:hypothetical protein